MKKKTVTKHALLASVLAMVLCVTMLVGTTFAWFTDTASANVNKIQSGNLKIELQNKEGKSLEGETLKWVAKDGRAQDAILWEPGCTYELEPFQVVNAGNLNLKYKIAISGIQGDAKLLKAITFTYKLADGTQYDLSAEKSLGVTADTKSSGLITISGHMDENAGNEYKNLSIEGIAITVYATQDNVESDSYGPDYDKDANGNPDHPEWGDVKANVTETAVAGENTVLSNSDKTVTATVPANAVAEGTNLTLTVTPTTKPAAITVASDEGSKAYDVKITGLADGNTTPITVELFVGKGLNGVKVYHAENTTEIGAEYDEETGYVTFTTTSFSPFTVVYDAPAMISADGAYSYDLGDLEYGGTWTMLKDVSVATLTNFQEGEKTVLNLNGKTLTVTTSGASITSYVGYGSALTIKNGTMKYPNVVGNPVWYGAFTVEKNSSMTIENVVWETTGSGVFPCGENATLNVINSSIKAQCYAIGTNAGKAENYGVVINIKGSTVTSSSSDGDNTALYVNVPCTLNIEDSTITADRQGMFVRGGTATIENSTIRTTAKYADQDKYVNGTWGGGNEVPAAALTVGNRHANSYQYSTSCTLKNVKLVADNNGRTLYIDSNDVADQSVTLTYDDSSDIGTIVKGTGTYITVNGPKQ